MGRFSRAKDRLLRRAKEKPDGEAKGSGRGSSSAAPPSKTVNISSVPTITTQPVPQIKPPISQTLSPVSASPATTPSSIDQTAASNKVSPAIRADTDPWIRAYKIVEEREPELMTDYKRHIASLQAGTTTSGDPLTPQTIESVVSKLLEDREKKQWQVSLLGKDIKIREQVERLATFLLWSDQIVKPALSTQPYAALAWSGVSILLLVSKHQSWLLSPYLLCQLLTSGSAQKEAMLSGFNSVVDLQVYWNICEKAYLKSAHRQDYESLVRPLAKLYSYIIEYQARAICHLAKAQVSRA